MNYNISIENEIEILIVDDDTFVLDYLTELLKEYGYQSISTNNPIEALKIFQSKRSVIVLTDIKMQGISGIDLLHKIRDINPDTPVILMTGYAELNTAIEAIQKGAFDFICKPFKAEYIINSLRKAIRHYKALQAEKDYMVLLESSVKSKTAELNKALIELRSLNREIIERLATAAEFRDTDSAAHFSRISLYTNKIAEAMNFDSDYIEIITLASKLHDIGKIAIPDSILLKPNPLTPDEWEIMKTHTTIGEKILSGSHHKILQVAASIALNHHEKWDGSGYPRGLKGNDIPIEGRILIICDQYDALRSRRHYKKSYSHKDTLKILTEGDDRTKPSDFDPDVLKAFLKVADSFDDIFETNKE